MTEVPAAGLERTSTSPPTSLARSRIPMMPKVGAEESRTLSGGPVIPWPSSSILISTVFAFRSIVTLARRACECLTMLLTASCTIR